MENETGRRSTYEVTPEMIAAARAVLSPWVDPDMTRSPDTLDEVASEVCEEILRAKRRITSAE
jgi:hypothetical protein